MCNPVLFNWKLFDQIGPSRSAIERSGVRFLNYSNWFVGELGNYSPSRNGTRRLVKNSQKSVTEMRPPGRQWENPPIEGPHSQFHSFSVFLSFLKSLNLLTKLISSGSFEMRKMNAENIWIED